MPAITFRPYKGTHSLIHQHRLVYRGGIVSCLHALQHVQALPFSERTCGDGSTSTRGKTITAPTAPNTSLASDSPAYTKSMKKGSIVSSLIVRQPQPGESSPMIALFRRSNEAKVYPGLLGVVSGSIEASDTSPTAAAWREIREETALGPDQLTLKITGKPYTYRDPNLNREWTINPFLFELRHPSMAQYISLNSEHSGFEWHDPITIAEDDRQIVPKITEALKRVCISGDLGKLAGRELEAGLDKIRSSHTSGVPELASNALIILKHVAELIPQKVKIGTWWNNLRMVAWHLWQSGRLSMNTGVQSVVIEALSRANELVRSTPQNIPLPPELRNDVLRAFSIFAEQRIIAGEKISNAFVSFLGSLRNETRMGNQAPTSVLTCSPCSIVTNALKAASKRVSLDVRVLESRSQSEIASVAEQFVDCPNITVTVYANAAVGYACRDIHMVLLGANSISALGAVNTKIGALPAVLTAAHIAFKSQVVILGNTEEVATGECEIQENATDEITDIWTRNLQDSARVPAEALATLASSGQQNLRVRNTNFEWLRQPAASPQWTYLCENGKLDLTDIAGKVKRKNSLLDNLFMDL